MPPMNRRHFLRRTGAMAGFVALGSAACRRPPSDGAEGDAGGYGPLAPAGDILALPRGFTYVELGAEGAPMSDGHPTPRAHDGMAAFPLPDGRVRLIRNHEVTTLPSVATPIGGPDGAYDLRGGGGTTSLEVDPRTRELLRDFVSLNGTIVNCAGGPTPWGSWLSCEETVGGTLAGWARPHGYVFEVPVRAEGPVYPVPLRAMGRFVHEAVAVDPATGIIYLTEDFRNASGFYRFRPEDPWRPGHVPDLAAGGRLEMLAVRERPAYDTTSGQTAGVPLAVDWVPIPDPDPPDAEHRPAAVFEQGLEGGGARFDRLEGCFYGDGAIYFDATEGGDAELGQIWRYRPDREELVLLFESRNPAVLKRPDNLCVTPRGGLLVCEDPVRDPFLRGLTGDGRVFDFAKNLMNDREFAGATFSPDGRTLFVNIQGDRRGPVGQRSVTLAIWGPWERGAL